MEKMKWKYLKALNDLYSPEKRGTTIDISSEPYIKRYLIKEKGYIKKKLGGQKITIWIPSNGFDSYYEKYHKDDFEEYLKIFIENDIPYSGKQTYEEKDIRALVFVKNEREQILTNKPSEKELIIQFFEEEAKYFDEGNSSLRKAVLKILGIKHFEGDDEKENQWRFVVDCPNAKYVVLCENKDRLKVPKRALDHFIELWHVGGNNLKPLEGLSEEKLTLPIFYTCDWDFSGLSIFSRVKKMIEERGGKIHLLIPPNYIKRFDTKSKRHRSIWNDTKILSGLSKNDFSLTAQKLIDELIKEDKYMQEEGTNLIEMIGGINFPQP